LLFLSLPLFLMKKKIAILNFVLSAAVLFAMLFQSFHSYEHLAKQLSEKHCAHEHHSKAEITHQHHGAEHCFVCEFNFSSFVAPEIFSFESYSSHKEIPYFHASVETPASFSGSTYSLRGPPLFIA
jgi:hypothetical protein